MERPIEIVRTLQILDPDDCRVLTEYMEQLESTQQDKTNPKEEFELSIMLLNEFIVGQNVQLKQAVEIKPTSLNAQGIHQTAINNIRKGINEVEGVIKFLESNGKQEHGVSEADVCLVCKVPIDVHGTSCGWPNASLLLFPWEKSISVDAILERTHEDSMQRYSYFKAINFPSKLSPQVKEIPYKELEKRLDEQLDSETKESLDKWLNSK